MKRTIKLLSLSFIALFPFTSISQCDTTEHKETYKNGSYAVGTLVCEEKDGTWMYHDKKDRLIKKVQYDKGQLNGTKAVWYTNGQQNPLKTGQTEN